MALTEKINKRGIRIAYDDDGNCKGGDIAQVVQVCRDGEMIAEGKEELVPIAGSVQQGLVAADVMNEAAQDAIAGANVMRAERDAARTERDDEKAARAQAEKERDAKCQECDNLQAQVAERDATITTLQARVAQQDSEENGPIPPG